METAASFEKLQHAFDTCYAWNYQIQADSLRDLYAKSKLLQWNGATDLAWETPVDPDGPNFPDEVIPIFGSAVWDRLTSAERARLKRENTAWTISQFLHGEQGALLATSQIVASVPSFDAKYYGATQVMDEARHVEVYERYLREKLQLTYPVSPELKSLLDVILTDSRWDMKYLGMQIMVEGLALAAFRLINSVTEEPLIRNLTQLVMRDEARHVAFGVLSLKDHYRTMDPRELREREDFVIESSRLMRDRFLAQAVWEKLGLPVRECMQYTLESATMVQFRSLLFGTIVPNLKRLGLLTPRVRAAMADLGVLHLEDADPDAMLSTEDPVSSAAPM